MTRVEIRIVSKNSMKLQINTTTYFAHVLSSLQDRNQRTMAPNVILETSMGDIVIELYDQHAPRTCTNFSTLASRGYFDGHLFHRYVVYLPLSADVPLFPLRSPSSNYRKS